MTSDSYQSFTFLNGAVTLEIPNFLFEIISKPYHEFLDEFAKSHPLDVDISTPNGSTFGYNDDALTFFVQKRTEDYEVEIMLDEEMVTFGATNLKTGEEFSEFCDSVAALNQTGMAFSAEVGPASVRYFEGKGRFFVTYRDSEWAANFFHPPASSDQGVRASALYRIFSS